MLIIFDCDGVLVDSESLAANIFSEVLNGVGIALSPQACFETFHGKTLLACYMWLENTYKITLPAGFSQSIDEQTRRRFSRELQPVDGIFSVLHYLRDAGIAFCVASNGGHEKISNSLSTTAMLSYFPHRFSADDVRQGKPYPDVFLLAAQQMGEPAQDTWVIEDSQAGYSAAVAANMNVLMYTPDGKGQEFPCARSFTSMVELIDILKALNK